MASGYFRAKLAQESRAPRTPYAMLRATTFFEYTPGIADDATGGPLVRLALCADPACRCKRCRRRALADLAFSTPLDGTVEMVDAEQFPLDDVARSVLQAEHDVGTVVADSPVPYLGVVLAVGGRSLLPNCA